MTTFSERMMTLSNEFVFFFQAFCVDRNVLEMPGNKAHREMTRRLKAPLDSGCCLLSLGAGDQGLFVSMENWKWTELENNIWVLQVSQWTTSAFSYWSSDASCWSVFTCVDRCIFFGSLKKKNCITSHVVDHSTCLELQVDRLARNCPRRTLQKTTTLPDDTRPCIS